MDANTNAGATTCAAPSLAAPTRRKLLGAIALLASEHPGEAAAAGAAVDRILSAHGLVLENILGQAASAPSASSPAAFVPDRLGIARFAAAHPASFSPWEIEFAANMAKSWTVSPKQRARLARLAAKIQRIAAGGAA